MATSQSSADKVGIKETKKGRIRDNLADSLFPSSPSEWRENVKMMMAAGLAIGSWIMLGSLLWSHFDASRQSAATITEFIASPANKDLKPEERLARVAALKDAHELVDKTSNSIYVLVMPLATAITGFFFISVGLTKKNADSSELPPTPDIAEETTGFAGSAANANLPSTLTSGSVAGI